MVKKFSHLNPPLREFIGKQAMPFLTTTPPQGNRINLSPKRYPDTRIQAWC